MSGKTNSRYQQRFLEDIDDHFKKGGTMTSFPAVLKIKYGISVTKRTVYNWIKRYPKFARAIEVGNCTAQMHLEYLLWAAILGKAPKGSKKINSKSLEFALKTRFHPTYGVKNTIELDGEQQDNKIVIVRAKDADDF